ncbi:desulfoferrodoxin [Candidatus Saccharibacteria bacterium]|nr:desulfoferrodoxin [Candidatus Saccharibacteria bacterium]
MQQEGLKFYRCNTCGNLFLTMIDPDVIPTCCGSSMEILEANKLHEGAEKHIPIIEILNNTVTVKVGIQPHPMAAEHRIEWVALTNGNRVEIQKLGLTSQPVAIFTDMPVGDGKLRAYSFCNIHGLWSSEK